MYSLNWYMYKIVCHLNSELNKTGTPKSCCNSTTGLISWQESLHPCQQASSKLLQFFFLDWWCPSQGLSALTVALVDGLTGKVHPCPPLANFNYHTRYVNGHHDSDKKFGWTSDFSPQIGETRWKLDFCCFQWDLLYLSNYGPNMDRWILS